LEAERTLEPPRIICGADLADLERNLDEARRAGRLGGREPLLIITGVRRRPEEGGP